VFYQIVVGFALAFFSVTGTVVVYWIRERDPSTREFERQKKRLEFWKAFWELEALAPTKPGSEYQQRCKEAMEQAARSVQALPTKAARWSGRIIGAAIAILSLLLLVSFGRFISNQPNPPTPQSTIVTVVVALFELVLFFLIALHAFGVIFYKGGKKMLTESLLTLADKYPRFSYLKDIE
jgi:hypothetical protein